MTQPSFEFYFDYSSPFAYLGSTQVPRLASEFNAHAVLKPILLGAIFKAIGTPMVPVMTFPEVKRNYYGKDLDRWAKHWGVPFKFTTRFPMNTVKPLRLTLAMMADESPQVESLMHAIFKALWVDNRDISSPETLAEILSETNIDGSYLEKIGDESVKTDLRNRTDEAITRGVCGAPTYAVDEMLFWGQDRVALVEHALKGWRPNCG